MFSLPCLLVTLLVIHFLPIRMVFYFYFSVLAMGLWPRQSTTLVKAFVVLWDQESRMEGRKPLSWWKEDTRPWNRAEGPDTITPWIPAGGDMWTRTTADTLTQSGIVSLSPVLVKWVSLSDLTPQLHVQVEKNKKLKWAYIFQKLLFCILQCILFLSHSLAIFSPALWFCYIISYKGDFISCHISFNF